MEGAPPFVPVIEMTEQAARASPQALRAALGHLAPEIATIVPSLRRMDGDIPPPSEVPPEQRRRLVFDAYPEDLRQATQQSPRVVLFDDVHWADEATLQLWSMWRRIWRRCGCSSSAPIAMSSST